VSKAQGRPDGDDRPAAPGSASKHKGSSMYAPRRLGASPGGGGGGHAGGVLGRLPRGRSAGLWLLVPVSLFEGRGGQGWRAQEEHVDAGAPLQKDRTRGRLAVVMSRLRPP